MYFKVLFIIFSLDYLKIKKTPTLLKYWHFLCLSRDDYFIMPSLACSRTCFRIFFTPRALEATRFPEAR